MYMIKYNTHLLKPKHGSVVTSYIKHTIIMPKAIGVNKDNRNEFKEYKKAKRLKMHNKYIHY